MKSFLRVAQAKIPGVILESFLFYSYPSPSVSGNPVGFIFKI
jgi:hypothetical protein